MRIKSTSENFTSQTLIDLSLGSIARLAAGVLFIVPGILSDLLALVLLLPAGRRLVLLLIGLSLKGNAFSLLG